MACPECFHIFNEFNLKEKPYELSTTTNQILRMRNLNHCECMLLSQYCRVISINQDTKRPMPTLCNTMLLCLFLLLTLNRNLHRRITGWLTLRNFIHQNNTTFVWVILHDSNCGALIIRQSMDQTIEMYF